MITAFFFPKLSKMITDEKIRTFIDKTNSELLQEGQEASQILNVATKARRFLMNQIWIMEDLILTLKEEKMTDAVIQITNEMYSLGLEMENGRMQVFSLLILGELIS